MRRALALLTLLALGACGPMAATYEVDLVLTRSCSTRDGVESCETIVGDRLTRSLLVEPRDDSVLLWLGETLFVAPSSSGELEATRRLEHTDLELGCVRRIEQVLVVLPDSNEVQGTLDDETLTDGPEAQCGQTPFGERLRYDLNGLEIDGP